MLKASKKPHIVHWLQAQLRLTDICAALIGMGGPK